MIIGCIYILFFSGRQGSWSLHVSCLHLKMEFRSCAMGRHSLLLMNGFNKTELLFSRAGYASLGLSLSSICSVSNLRGCVCRFIMVP